MRYIGSKTSTLPWLSHVIKERAPNAASLCDPFAGTCTVARYFKKAGLRVITGDVLRLSYVFQVATIGLDQPPSFKRLPNNIIDSEMSASPSERVLAHLNELPGREGYIYENYSPASSTGRLFFTPQNAARIDAIRKVIGDWSASGVIDESEKGFLLASLIDAADKVANTAGTYYAHLKEFSRKAVLPLKLVALPTTSCGTGSTCHQLDARELSAANDVDILYLDPPYNQRNYLSYYHLPESLARQEEPSPQGKSGAPKNMSEPSDFCRQNKAANALAEVCNSARARHIMVHYTPDGLISHKEIMAMLSGLGKVQFDDLAVRAYASRSQVDGGTRKVWHRVYWCDVNIEKQKDASSRT